MLRRLAVAIAIAAPCTDATAQLTPLPGTGCRNGGTAPPPIFAVGAPTIGNLSFAIQYPTPSAATIAIAIFGTCRSSGPAPNWDLTANCFSPWPSPPSTCGMGFQSVTWMDAIVTHGGFATYPLPIPALPNLPALMQANPLCVQFVPAMIGVAPSPTLWCIEVSPGARLIAQ